MLFISFAARDLIKALVNKGYSFFGERGFDQQLHDRVSNHAIGEL